MDAIGHARLLGGQLGTIPRQIPQLTLRHEAALQESALQQLSDPFGVAQIRFAAGHLLDMTGVHQKQGEPSLQDVPDRLPEDAGRFYSHVCHTERFEVVGQRQEVPGRGSKSPDLGEEFPGFQAATYANGKELLMHVQSGYPGIDGVHGDLLRRRASEDVARETFCSACSPKAGGNNTGYAATSGPD